MSWQELGHSIWGRWSGLGTQIVSLHRDNNLSGECSWIQNQIIQCDLGWKQKQRTCSSETRSQKCCMLRSVSATLTPPLPSLLTLGRLLGVTSPLSNSLVFLLSRLCVWDWHRRECVWERWYGGRALACCQLFWWLQIASALVGWSRHQQAEELSKELPQLSLIHAWCTTRWQNTATAYGGGGGRQRARGTGGGAFSREPWCYSPYFERF